MKLKESVIITEVAGSHVLVEVENAKGDSFHGVVRLNETAYFMVNILRGGCTEEELVSKVMEEYEGEPEKIKADVAGLLEKLRGIGLIIE